MKRRNILTLFAIAALGLALLPGSAVSQQKSLKDQIIGTWAMVSNVTTRADGAKVDTWGPSPKGMAFFESNGRFSVIAMRSDLPNFASNNRGTGTPDENKAVVQGSVAYFGTYAVNEADRSVTVQIAASTYPNWVGTSQTRMAVISGDELTYSSPTASAGGSAEIKLKRVR